MSCVVSIEKDVLVDQKPNIALELRPRVLHKHSPPLTHRASSQDKIMTKSLRTKTDNTSYVVI